MAGFFNPDDLTWWKEHWQDMPEFSQEDLLPKRTIMIHFISEEDIKEFSALLKQNISKQTKYLWFPASEKVSYRELGWHDEP